MNYNGETALHNAAWKGNVDVCALLLSTVSFFLSFFLINLKEKIDLQGKYIYGCFFLFYFNKMLSFPRKLLISLNCRLKGKYGGRGCYYFIFTTALPVHKASDFPKYLYLFTNPCCLKLSQPSLSFH